VDELQDTDPIQAEVLLYLKGVDVEERDWQKARIAPGSLFLVGDPKQPIYRFRRADIDTYNLLKKITVESGGEVLSLTSNFRSLKALAQWNNPIFKIAFPAEATRHQAAFAPLDTVREEEAGTTCGVYKIIMPKVAWNKKEEIAEADAAAIAEWIGKACGEGKLRLSRSKEEKERGLGAAAQPRDFMILYRYKKFMSVYARALEERGIPFEITGSDAFAESEEIGEITNLATTLNEVVHQVLEAIGTGRVAFPLMDDAGAKRVPMAESGQVPDKVPRHSLDSEAGREDKGREERGTEERSKEAQGKEGPDREGQADFELYVENLLVAEERDIAEKDKLIALVDSILRSEFWRRVMRAERRYFEIPFSIKTTESELNARDTSIKGSDKIRRGNDLSLISNLPVILTGTIDLVFWENGAEGKNLGDSKDRGNRNHESAEKVGAGQDDGYEGKDRRKGDDEKSAKHIEGGKDSAEGEEEREEKDRSEEQEGKDGGWIIADYKTDVIPGTAEIFKSEGPELTMEKIRRVSPEFARVIDFYAPQVRLYTKFWSHITGEPVKESGLYFTSLNRWINIF
jgi:ATP-dependent exoDNAse (exonuclease V) beta subunit